MARLPACVGAAAQERNESMKARKHHEEPIDRQLIQELKQAREHGGITDDDRVVFFAP